MALLKEVTFNEALNRLNDSHFLSLQAKHKCYVCSEVLRYPLSGETEHHGCGHFVCSKCEHGNICGICRETVAWRKNGDKWRKIRSLEVKCPNQCQENWVGTVNELNAHLSTECSKELLECNLGCGLQVCRDNFTNHVENECERREVGCAHCHVNYQFHALPVHHGECQDFPVACPQGCHDALKRRDLVTHDDHCLEKVISCTYASVGCSCTFPRREEHSHMSTHLAVHMNLLLLNQVKSTQVIEVLQEQNAHLGHQLKEANLKQIDLEVKIGDLTQQLVQVHNQLEQKIASASRYTKGSLAALTDDLKDLVDDVEVLHKSTTKTFLTHPSVIVKGNRLQNMQPHKDRPLAVKLDGISSGCAVFKFYPKTFSNNEYGFVGDLDEAHSKIFLGFESLRYGWGRDASRIYTASGIKCNSERFPTTPVSVVSVHIDMDKKVARWMADSHWVTEELKFPDTLTTVYPAVRLYDNTPVIVA